MERDPNQRGPKETTIRLAIRLGYIITCGSSLIKIHKIKIAQLARGSNEVDLEVTMVTTANNMDTPVRLNLRVDEVCVEGVKFKVAKITVSTQSGIIAHSYPVNLGIVENAETPTPFVYFMISDLECGENSNIEPPSIEVRISKILIYPLQSVRVTRYRVFQEHENPFSARFTAEYTVVNNMPFPVRFLYLNLEKYIKGLEIRNEEDRVLRFLTRQELREIFGEDIIDKLREFFVVVELGEGLGPGEARILRLKGTEEINKETKDYFLGLQLPLNITEGVVIRPPHGYEVVINKEKDIVVVRDVSEITKNLDSEMVRRVFYDRDLARPIFTGSDDNRNSVRVDRNLRLDKFVNTNPKKKDDKEKDDKVSSPAVVDLQFRLYEDKESTSEEPLFRDPVKNPGIAIRYSLEVQHKDFWDSFLAFFSVLVFGLFFQEFFYDLTLDVMGVLFRLVSPFVFSIILVMSLLMFFMLGSLVGYSYVAYKKLIQTTLITRKLFESFRSSLEFIGRGFRKGKRLPGFRLMVLIYMLAAIIIAINIVEKIILNLYNPLHSTIYEIGMIYIELEFVTIVAIELAYFLAERAVRDEYRSVLLSLTTLTLVSMLLLVPWLV